MSELKNLKTKIEAELKNKNPSVSKILYEVEQVYNTKVAEIEKLNVRCRRLEKNAKDNRYAPERKTGPTFRKDA